MRLLKLPWLNHSVESRKVECYSLTVNAPGTRLASGGLDGNVKIWDTASIVGFVNHLDSAIHHDRLDLHLRRPLCSMSRHNGVVTSVKFSPDGRFLASGSDDKICLIWEKDDELASSLFGDAEADLEHWTVRKRLVAHDNDIQDICWLCDGLLLVTVGLDRLIIIWNGLTFERIKRYDVHQSMVKGIVFDPANKFFATASDDRSVRVFRYHKKNDYLSYEFQVEHVVLDPFKKSPLSSYFRRMSWSPDGQHIAVPNATNGPVSSIVIVNRGNWSTDISLIGHEAPCEVCSFCPRLFENESNPLDPPSFSTILATAGQDRTVAIWRTGNMRPVVVAHSVSSSSITDMCWLPDGSTLYLSSLDGLITCMIFETGDLGTPVSSAVVNTQLHKFGVDRDSVVFPESVSQLLLEDAANKFSSRKKPPSAPLKLQNPPPLVPSKINALPSASFSDLSNPFPRIASTKIAAAKKPSQKITQVTTMKNGKRRVAPMLVSSASTAAPTPAKPRIEKKTRSSRVSKPQYAIPRLGIPTAVHGIKLKWANDQALDPALGPINDNDNDNIDMGINESSCAFNNHNTAVSEAALKRQRHRTRRLAAEARYPNCFKYVSNLPQELFNNQAVVNRDINALLGTITSSAIEGELDVSNNTAIDVDENIIFSAIVRWIRHTVRPNGVDVLTDSKHVVTTIEVRNGKAWPQYEDEYTHDSPIDFDDPTKVLVSNNAEDTRRQYTLFFAYKIQHVYPMLSADDTLDYIVLISFHGIVQILSATSGRYVCAPIELGKNVVLVALRDDLLCVLTSSGMIHMWKLSLDQSQIRCILSSVSILPVVNLMPLQALAAGNTGTLPKPTTISYLVPQVTHFQIDALGMPCLIMQTAAHIYRYNKDLEIWVRLLDAWHYLAFEEQDFDVEKYPQIDGCASVRASLRQHWQDVKRQRICTYDLAEMDAELRTCMKSRFHELTSG